MIMARGSQPKKRETRVRAIPRRFALLFLLLAAAAQAQQDTWKDVGRIVAVGDVHGDFEQFAKTLRAAGVVDARNDWAAGKTHLVQLGDVLDRGPDSRQAMDLLMKLEEQAAKAGGRVHALLGNHEAMVLAGDWRYLHPGEIKAFGSEEAFRQAMSAEGVYGQWLRGHHAVIQINDVLFAHAGLVPAATRPTLREINDAIRKELAEGNEHGLAASSSGPLWNRFLARGDEEAVAAALDEVFRKYGAAHMVIGHTVAKDGIAVRAGGRLIQVDVGMCEYYGGPAACLVIEKGVFSEVRHPSARRVLDVEGAAPRTKMRKAG